MLSWTEIARHNSRASCWLVISGQAYDVTDFLDSHPGGAKTLLRYGGQDATAEYVPIHPAGTIERYLPRENHLGPIDPASKSVAKTPNTSSQGTPSPNGLSLNPLPISLCMNLLDLETAAEQTLSRRAWTYFHSAADGLGSLNNNAQDWRKVTLRPLVLRNVARVRMDRTIMGHHSSLPFFIAPAAMARLAHPDGELCLARGAARKNIPYCVSTYSSVAHEELAACLNKERKGSLIGCLFFQLYVPRTHERTLELIDTARKLGFKALVVTVDTPVVGKREEDERYKAELEYLAGETEPIDISRTADPGLETDAPILRGVHSSTLNWEDLRWIREAWGIDTGPVILKGIQTAEDAKRAAGLGIDGIYLSNHGGRQIDDGPSSLRTLLEIRKFCPEILGKIEIYLDGGVRRGADVLKALALGATAVALGRPFMYALGAFGTEGVLKAIQLLSDEIETTMRLMGVTDLSQLNPDMANATILERELPPSLAAFAAHLSSKL